MSKVSETGHAKNEANWAQLITFVTSYGTDYNPSNPAIKTAALQSIADNAKNSSTVTNIAWSGYKNARAAREVAFDALGPLVTRTVNAVKATGTTKQVDEGAIALARKVKGGKSKRKSKPVTTEPADEEKEIIENSTSQMSFDNRLANTENLITLLESVPEYAPNEEDIKPTALRSFYSDLKTKNDATVAAVVALSNARIARNVVLYKPLTGMVDLSVDVKNYVKSVYGARSPQFKQISKLVFKNIKS